MFYDELPVTQCDACDGYSDCDGGWLEKDLYPVLKESAWICSECKIIDLKGTEFYKTDAELAEMKKEKEKEKTQS